MLSDKENHSRKSQFPGRWQAAAFRDEDRFERDAFDAVGSEVHLRPQLDPRPSLLQLSCYVNQQDFAANLVAHESTGL